MTQHKDYNVSVSYWHVSSPCAVWLSAIPNRLRLNRVTRKYCVFRVTFNTMCSHRCFMAVRLHQLVLRTKTMCLRDVFHTNSVLSWFVGCPPPLFVYDWIAPHAKIMSSVWRLTQCAPSSSSVQFTFPIWLWDENAWWWKWSCFRCVINTPLASEVEWKQDWCNVKKWNDQCTNGFSTVVGRNGISGIVTAQNQFQAIVFICVGFAYKCYHITVLCDI